ncbi:soluble NSF attachment protein, partial [Ochromonadaceae sp. CCMP2298]
EAADLFVNDHKKSNANQCFLKVATLASDMGDLSRAAAIFEDIGKDSLTSRLGAYSAKGYFFQSLLCHLALGDNVAVTQKLDSCKNLDFSFNGSRECEFIDKLLQACEGMDLEAYSDACMDFDRVSPLDPWKTSLLLKAKAFIAEATGDEVDLS